ncbi:MAG: anthranilate synthase component I family protein [Chitinophagales bacterium]|nr:anthranilate synthase component I family protein [Chitinophagales bacterium]
MIDFFSVKYENTETFNAKLLVWAQRFSTFIFLDSNQNHDRYGEFDFILAVDALDFYTEIEELQSGKFYFGHISYDTNTDAIPFVNYGSTYFFEPRYILYGKNERLYFNRNATESLAILDAIIEENVEPYSIPKFEFQERTSASDYQDNIYKIQEAIRKGQFYELNYCVEFFKENIELNPVSTFLEINKHARSPMSALLKYDGKWALSFSPERLACLRGNKLISQPIKGTARRDLTSPKNDIAIKNELATSIKERAENTMIVDLVRHDMTTYAETGSIKVEELCEIYTFPFVHQMISTISAQLRDKNDGKKALKKLLPAGSMTGAPKKEVMQYIAQIENFHRGLYAGNIGYFAPNGDFDFNVVIRTLYYDATIQRLSLAVGGAITLLSDAEKEYHECLLKAEGIRKFFRG